MSGKRMSGERLFTEEHYKRLYYSSLMRTTCLALIQMHNDKYPWETEEWSEDGPELTAFLSNADSEYGTTQREFEVLLQQFSRLAEKYYWLGKSFYESAVRDQFSNLPTNLSARYSVIWKILLALESQSGLKYLISHQVLLDVFVSLHPQCVFFLLFLPVFLLPSP